MENNTYYITKDQCTVITPVNEGIDSVKNYHLGIASTYFIKKGTSVVCGSHKDTAKEDGVLITFFPSYYTEDRGGDPFTISYDPILLKKITGCIEWDKAREDRIQKETSIGE